MRELNNGFNQRKVAIGDVREHAAKRHFLVRFESSHWRERNRFQNVKHGKGRLKLLLQGVAVGKNRDVLTEKHICRK